MTKSELLERLNEMLAEAEEKLDLSLERKTPGGAMFFNGIATGLTKAIEAAKELDDDENTS